MAAEMTSSDLFKEIRMCHSDRELSQHSSEPPYLNIIDTYLRLFWESVEYFMSSSGRGGKGSNNHRIIIFEF